MQIRLTPNYYKAGKKLLSPYGLHDLDKGGSGADIGPLKGDDVTLVGYRPDSQRYFDYHHTSTDTFDKVNKRELEIRKRFHGEYYLFNG